MSLELRNITTVRSEFEECQFFKASIFINGKESGSVEGDAVSRQMKVSLNESVADEVRVNARVWLNELDPNPINTCMPWPLDNNDFERTDCSERDGIPSSECLEMCITGIYSNVQILNEIEKIRSRASYTLTTSRYLSFRFVDIDPMELTDEQRLSVESEEGFDQWLYNKTNEQIALRLGYRQRGDGPLVTVVG